MIIFSRVNLIIATELIQLVENRKAIILCTATNCAFSNGQNSQEKLNHEEHEEARRLEAMLL